MLLNENVLYCKVMRISSALKRKHPALKKMKFQTVFNFSGPFLPFWIWTRVGIAYADPDPGAQLNPDPGCGSTKLVCRLR
jgi:hypothetical protein